MLPPSILLLCYIFTFCYYGGIISTLFPATTPRLNVSFNPCWAFQVKIVISAFHLDPLSVAAIILVSYLKNRKNIFLPVCSNGDEARRRKSE